MTDVNFLVVPAPSLAGGTSSCVVYSFWFNARGSLTSLPYTSNLMLK
jgi:hypothetical protein